MTAHTESRDRIAPKVRPPVHIRGEKPAPQEDHPNKPFRTPSKNQSHPAPETGADGDVSKHLEKPV
jgi:hypothetical protein